MSLVTGLAVADTLDSSTMLVTGQRLAIRSTDGITIVAMSQAMFAGLRETCRIEITVVYAS